jgi:hypothetical protein
MSVGEIFFLAFILVSFLAFVGTLAYVSFPRSEGEITPPTLDWCFSNDPVDNQRLRLQVASDIYRALQTRLDGYRQSAAAIFLGVIAGLLTLDASVTSNFGKIIVGVDIVGKPIYLRIGYIILDFGVILAIAWYFIYRILSTISYYFAEMAGVVYKFDLANKVFITDAWFTAQTLYPHSFRTDKTLVISGETLSVWYDPSIRVFYDPSRLFLYYLPCMLWVSSSLVLYGIQKLKVQRTGP